MISSTFFFSLLAAGRRHVVDLAVHLTPHDRQELLQVQQLDRCRVDGDHPGLRLSLSVSGPRGSASGCLPARGDPAGGSLQSNGSHRQVRPRAGTAGRGDDGRDNRDRPGFPRLHPADGVGRVGTMGPGDQPPGRDCAARFGNVDDGLRALVPGRTEIVDRSDPPPDEGLHGGRSPSAC